MDTESLKQELTDLSTQCDQARQAGDYIQEADLQREVALRLTILGKFNQAKKRLRRALKLNQRTKRRQDESKTLYILGMVEARSSMQLNDSLPYFEQALTGFREIGDRVLEGRTQIYLGTLKLMHNFQKAGQQILQRSHIPKDLSGFGVSESEFQVIDGHLAEAIQAFSEAQDVNRLLDTLRYRTVLLLFRGHSQEAYGSMAKAIEVAKQHGRETELLQLQLDVYNVTSLSNENPKLRAIMEILHNAAQTGQERVAAYARFIRARDLLRSGNIEEAIQDGQVTRQLALQNTDPTLYLLSCLLMAEGEEQRHNRLAVLNILFTCQASLGKLLGKEARLPILMVIDSLKQRWGQANFDRVMAKYRTQFATNSES